MIHLNKEDRERRYYLRSCSYCKKGLSVGYVWGNGEAYGCDGCYIKHNIAWAVSLSDNEFFLKTEDKEDFIMEMTDQLYVGWDHDDDDGEYYNYKGKSTDLLPPNAVVVYGYELYDLETQNYEWKEIVKDSEEHAVIMKEVYDREGIL